MGKKWKDDKIIVTVLTKDDKRLSIDIMKKGFKFRITPGQKVEVPKKVAKSIYWLKEVKKVEGLKWRHILFPW
jgi:hypothetical protein